MTDLEKHVSRPGRDKLVKKVREKIDELGITYIFFQFISVIWICDKVNIFTEAVKDWKRVWCKTP